MAKSANTRITLTAAKAMQSGQTLWDADIKGFGLRCQAKSKSYLLKTRVKGRQRILTIGRHGSPWTPETARKEALRLMADIANGIDPATRKQKELAEPTIKDVAARFLTEHGPKLKPSTLASYERIFRLHITPDFGTRKVGDVMRCDASRLHAAMADTPRLANYTLDLLSILMNWSEEMGLRPEYSNPCRKIKKYRENKRERYLSTAELTRLGEVLDKSSMERSESEFVIAAVRLLILTGARLGEILTLKWDYVDYDRELLNLPDSKTGQKLIKLNKPALDELRRLPRVLNNPYVVVGHRKGEHLVNMQKPWRRIRSEAGLDDVRLHDLRHSFASFAAQSGASLPMIGNLLGHTQTRTTARYAHLAEDPMKQLNNEIGSTISDALRGKASDLMVAAPEGAKLCQSLKNRTRIKASVTA